VVLRLLLVLLSEWQTAVKQQRARLVQHWQLSAAARVAAVAVA
jgi:hypothetical protein